MTAATGTGAYAPVPCSTCGTLFTPRRVDQTRCRKECRKRPGHGTLHEPILDRRFVAWDGEAQDDHYTLLQNSDGACLYDRRGIGTERAFDFLCSGARGVNNVWFGVGYDVNMICRDLPWRKILDLATNGHAWWNGWSIGYIPRKSFRVAHKQTRRSFTSYDVQTFFASSFIGALETWHLPVPDEIREGKAARDSFHAWTRRDLERYNGAEVDLLVRLMDGLRAAIIDAGWSVKGWHGPGALAGWFLGANVAPADLRQPNQYRTLFERAYFGGRIDAAGWGRVEGAYHYDIVSAYPAAMRECPSLDGATWTRRPGLPSAPFALARVRWRVADSEAWPPFPWRASDGRILWPTSGEGWYWWPEVEAALERFGARRLRLKVLEVCEPSFDGSPSYPMRAPIEEAFEHRRALKASDHPANVPIKLGLNSLYGKCAQTVSYGRTPRFYSLAWAGYLTARARADLQRAIARAGAYAVMTDSIWTREPLPASWLGTALGKWDGGEYGPLALVSPGVYAYDGEQYTRGFERSALAPVDTIIDLFEQGADKVPFEVRRFIGMRLAAVGGDWSLLWRTWATVPREIHNPGMFGTTKRYPTVRSRSGWHPLAPYEAAGLSARYKKATMVEDIEAERLLGECDD